MNEIFSLFSYCVKNSLALPSVPKSFSSYSFDCIEYINLRVNCNARTTCTNSSGVKPDLGLEPSGQPFNWFYSLSFNNDQPTAVLDHFTLSAHSLDNIELVPLELITSNRDAIRKEREAFLMSKGKTLEPFGLNRRNEI